MKIALSLLNLTLGLLLAWATVDLMKPASAKSSGYTVKKRVPAKKGVVQKKSDAAPSAVPAPAFRDREEMIQAIVDGDLFNPERSPNASTRGRGGRIEMVLVGTFKIGDTEGAIIRQNTIQRQFNPFLAHLGGGPGGGPGGGRAPGPGLNRFSGGLQRFGAGLNPQNNTQPIRQYVRVGETLANGYKLIEVTRTNAVLVRGGDRTELELQMPSRGRVAGGRAPQRLNPAQQLQQAQMATQIRIMQMMQQMQRSMNGGQGGGGVPPSRGGRGRNR